MDTRFVVALSIASITSSTETFTLSLSVMTRRSVVSPSSRPPCSSAPPSLYRFSQELTNRFAPPISSSLYFALPEEDVALIKQKTEGNNFLINLIGERFPLSLAKLLRDVDWFTLRRRLPRSR